MSPKRKIEDLKLNSFWDEFLVEKVLSNEKHRSKMWSWMISHPDSTLDQIPLASWSIPKAATSAILSGFVKFTTKIVERNESSRGDTTKLLIELQDGHRIETVIMKHKGHSTVCVSSQIGCQMGCRFCATGTMGIIGDLTSGEIIEQLVHANTVSKIRNVVFMGMGEPLNNYENVKKAVEFMIDNKRFGLSPKHITISTVGVLKYMYRLTAELPYVNLAFSLHAPNQEVRIKIVPAAAAHRLDKLMDAVDNHIQFNCKSWKSKSRKQPIKIDTAITESSNVSDVKTGSVESKQDKEESVNTCSSLNNTYNNNSGVMIEYILIANVNDLAEHAHELGRLLSTRREHILLNLIPYNPTLVAEDFKAPSQESINLFHSICIGAPYFIHTRVRQEKGQDIDSACGQLALLSSAEMSVAAAVSGNRGVVNVNNANNNSFADSTVNSNNTVDIEDCTKPPHANTAVIVNKVIKALPSAVVSPQIHSTATTATVTNSDQHAVVCVDKTGLNVPFILLMVNLSIPLLFAVSNTTLSLLKPRN